MRPTLTPGQLNIPRAVVYEHVRWVRAFGLDVDDVLSAAHDALVQSWLAFDPARSHNGTAGLSPYLVRGVRIAVRRAVFPRTQRERARRARRSLDAAPWLCAGRQDPDIALLESMDTVETWLAVLPLRWRHVARLSWVDGLTRHEAGARLGVSPQRVDQILRRCAARLRQHLLALKEEVCP